MTCLLIAAGCNVNIVEKCNLWQPSDQLVLRLPLCCVGSKDDMDEIVHMLIEAGTDLIHGNYSHILHKCVQSSVINQVCILLKHGVDLYARNECRETTLHLVVKFN